MSSGDLIADRRFGWARELEAKGDLAGAAGLMAQTLERAPGYAAAWFALAQLRERLGNKGGAIVALRQAVQADPADRHGATLHLVRLGAAPTAAVPDAYLRALFDGYAANFDEALTQGLSYRAPELLLHAVETARAGQMKFGAVLDLGCGTGLTGAAFRPFSDRMVGVDLSPAMLTKAHDKGIYERLIESEALAFLRGEPGAHYDLILAGDVFVYFDDLQPVLVAGARLLAPKGLIAFSVETHDGDGVILRQTLRYAHGAAHVRAAVQAAALTLVSLDSAATRTEKRTPVPGLIVVAAR